MASTFLAQPFREFLLSVFQKCSSKGEIDTRLNGYDFVTGDDTDRPFFELFLLIWNSNAAKWKTGKEGLWHAAYRIGRFVGHWNGGMKNETRRCSTGFDAFKFWLQDEKYEMNFGPLQCSLFVQALLMDPETDVFKWLSEAFGGKMRFYELYSTFARLARFKGCLRYQESDLPRLFLGLVYGEYPVVTTGDVNSLLHYADLDVIERVFGVEGQGPPIEWAVRAVLYGTGTKEVLGFILDHERVKLTPLEKKERYMNAVNHCSVDVLEALNDRKWPVDEGIIACACGAVELMKRRGDEESIGDTLKVLKMALNGAYYCECTAGETTKKAVRDALEGRECNESNLIREEPSFQTMIADNSAKRPKTT